MKSSFALTLALLAAASFAAPPDTSSIAEHSAVMPRLALYETWVREQMAYRHQPGVVIGIVHHEDLVWARGFGYRDLERLLPATPETVFRVGSVTKLFTATAILQLRDRRALRLDDPVTEHLPWLTYRDQFPEAPPITVRHLLTHTSGLPREAALPYWTDRRFPTRERIIEVLAGQENVFEPGARYKYSNLGLALLGEVVAAASGTSYKDYVTAHVLEPLGMTSTRVRYQDVDPERLATGYLIRRADGSQPVAPPTDSQALTPAADISSNLVDLARFVAAHLTGSRPEAPFLALHTLRDMSRVHWLASNWEGGRGLGFQVWRHGERTLSGHGGWVAGYRTQIAFDREAGFGVIVLTNSDEGGPGTYLRQAFGFLVPALARAVADPTPQAPEATGIERYAGAFHNPWGEVTDFVALDGQLTMYGHSYPPTSDLAGALTPLEAERQHTFRRPGDGEVMVFELRPDGRVARVKVGENYLFPAGCGQIGEDLQCTWNEDTRVKDGPSPGPSVPRQP